jgi:hypothetical protein
MVLKRTNKPRETIVPMPIFSLYVAATVPGFMTVPSVVGFRCSDILRLASDWLVPSSLKYSGTGVTPCSRPRKHRRSKMILGNRKEETCLFSVIVNLRSLSPLILSRSHRHPFTQGNGSWTSRPIIVLVIGPSTCPFFVVRC